MQAGETLRRGNNQVLLFPLSYINISQDEGGSYSHQGTFNIDFLGWNSNGRVYQCPYYAPCDLKLVAQDSVNAFNVWESVNQVYTADNRTEYITLVVFHDDNVRRYSINDIVHQGDLLGKTGTSGNVTGDHVHLNVAEGHYQGFTADGMQLKNSVHIYNKMYVNNTTIIDGKGHNWKTYVGPVYLRKKKKFKWVLYANKLRNKCL